MKAQAVNRTIVLFYAGKRAKEVRLAGVAGFRGRNLGRRSGKAAAERSIKLFEGVDSLCGAPDASTDEFDGGKVVFGALVISGCNASEVLNAIEEALDQIALS